MVSKGQNISFSEHGYVAYQIKENQECSNMVVNILLADPLPSQPWGNGSKGQNSSFSEQCHVAFNLRETLNAASL